MTQEEKVKLLKEAGVWDVIGYPGCIDKLIDLVAAHEREVCAKVCESLMNEDEDAEFMVALERSAADIRARGEA